MKPLFQRAKEDPKRVIYAEGEDERVLRAVQVVVDEGLAQPILVGRPEVVSTRVQRLGLRIRPGEDVPLINPQDDPRFRTYWQAYHRSEEHTSELQSLMRNSYAVFCLQKKK